MSIEHFPIVSVRLKGGLGNQMFQLASAYAMARLGGGVFCTSREKPEPDSRPTMYWDTMLTAWKPFLLDGPIPPNLYLVAEQSATTYMGVPVQIPKPGICLDGYLQSPKYFGTPEIVAEIRHLMSAPAKILDEVKTDYSFLLDPSVRKRVVVVHARRGDYLKAADCHGPLTAKYYKAATERMLETEAVKDPIFLLVSDDQTFWHLVWHDVPAFSTHTTIFLKSDETDVRTLTLLQQFNYFILANSTFSWWAAWLANRGSEGSVIVPAKWFGPTGPSDYEDIYEPHWIRL